MPAASKGSSNHTTSEGSVVRKSSAECGGFAVSESSATDECSAKH